MDTRGQGGTAVATRAWPQVKLAERFTGLEQPVALASARDGSGRLFVCEKPGRVRVIEGGQLRGEPFVDITDRVGVNHMEQGLLDVEFPPGGAGDHLYACYTEFDNTIVVTRFEHDGRRADPESEEIVLPVWHPYRNHNGGELAFGPDGYLYVGIGDGGSEYDPNGYGQDPSVMLAKILRIDPESVGGMHEDGECECAYHIPDDNPFVDNPYFAPETWHWGLRNPWRFSFDRQTGEMFIGDVGQDAWEEIDHAHVGQGGLNFGWALQEGNHSHGVPERNVDSMGEADLVRPIAEYGHREDGGIAVVGGYVYRGRKHEALRGTYVFGDYGNGRLYGLRRQDDGSWERREIGDTRLSVTAFGEDDDGELWVTTLEGGVYELEV